MARTGVVAATNTDSNQTPRHYNNLGSELIVRFQMNFGTDRRSVPGTESCIRPENPLEIDYEL